MLNDLFVSMLCSKWTRCHIACSNKTQTLKIKLATLITLHVSIRSVSDEYICIMNINEVHFSAVHKTAARALQMRRKGRNLRLFRGARLITNLFIACYSEVWLSCHWPSLLDIIEPFKQRSHEWHNKRLSTSWLSYLGIYFWCIMFRLILCNRQN